MTESEIVNKIITLYQEELGFLVKLRVHMEFDEEQYNRSVEIVEQYLALINTGRFIDRRVAYFVYEMVSQMSIEIPHFIDRNHPEAKKLVEATEKFMKLADRLFDYRDNLT